MSTLRKIHPKRVFALEKTRRNEDLYQIDVNLRDSPGALSQAAKVLADAQINIKTGAIFHPNEYSEEGFLTCFIDVNKAKESIKEVEEKLQKLKVVKNVKFIRPRPAPFDSFHFPVLHGDSRATIMPLEVFGALWGGLEHILKPSGLSAVLYSAGKRVGEETIKHLIEMYNFEGRELFLALLQANQATGWGIGEISNLDFHHSVADIVVYDCFEAVAWQNKKSIESCNWTRGYFAGSMSTIFHNIVEAVETKCLASGDPYCEFKVKPKN